jgi:pantothenate kinase-related protein Tda10
MYDNLLDPLTNALALNANASRIPLVVGVTGGPGAGKTTFANALVAHARAARPYANTLRLSLEDFYLPAAERERRGLPWRALPGSHDVQALVALLHAMESCADDVMSVPRFNMETGEVDQPELVRCPISICILEGWLVGYREPPYNEVADRVDLLIYLDAPRDSLREFRLERERQIRIASNGQRGMTADEVERFWREALEPGILQWVMPIRDRSDVVVVFDEHHQLARIGVSQHGQRKLWHQ